MSDVEATLGQQSTDGDEDCEAAEERYKIEIERGRSHVPRGQLERDGIPEFVWSKSLDDSPPARAVHAPARPSAAETIRMMGIAWRVGSYVAKERAANREPIIDVRGVTLSPPNPGPWSGVPCGGIGCGSIGRGYRGDFRRWAVLPGRYEHRIVQANQFSVRTATYNSNGELGDGISSVVLSSALTSDEILQEGCSGLSNWNWSMNPDCATYHALYPQAWTVYEEPVPGLRLVCNQVSPVLGPQDMTDPATAEYTESSFPAVVFEWTATNISGSHQEVSLMFTWQASSGLEVSAHQKHKLESVETFTRCDNTVIGVESRSKVQIADVYKAGDDMEPSWTQKLKTLFGKTRIASTSTHNDPAGYSIAVLQGESDDALVTTCTNFGCTSNTGTVLWSSFHSTGDIHDINNERGSADDVYAVCIRFKLNAQSKKTVVFALTWDVPMARFGSGSALPRWYTRFTGTTDGTASPGLATWALSRYKSWQRHISQWQMPVLRCGVLPAFYKHMLFNELYFISDGGTQWTDSTAGVENAKPNEPFSEIALSEYGLEPGTPESTSSIRIIDAIAVANSIARKSGGDSRQIGQFLYLEGQEYYMYNTYDVHFYASWALIQLWPMLELSLQRDVVSATASHDSTVRTMIGPGYRRIRKREGVVPHDLGSPSEDPWNKVNAYNFQDVSEWKDLGPKLILQVYRDFIATRDIQFLEYVWPTMLSVIEHTGRYDRDGDGLIENSGFPDQTYDIWSVKGPSAYTGGLWVAALAAVLSASKALLAAATEGMLKNMYSEDDLKELSIGFESQLRTARTAYVAKLWNGKYFNYDSSDSPTSDSCMADQCAGHLYVRACGLESVYPAEEGPVEYALSALGEVLRRNVHGFANIRARNSKYGSGRSETSSIQLIGAVNGMRPDGSIDMSCIQSREVWTGTTYALGATMLHESRCKVRSENIKEIWSNEMWRGAFETASGIYNGGWQEFGYWFGTPEAWEVSGNYRSLAYMRPLAIWAMQWALERG